MTGWEAILANLAAITVLIAVCAVFLSIMKMD